MACPSHPNTEILRHCVRGVCVILCQFWPRIVGIVPYAHTIIKTKQPLKLYKKKTQNMWNEAAAFQNLLMGYVNI